VAGERLDLHDRMCLVTGADAMNVATAAAESEVRREEVLPK
jgi:hypothetical protein